MPWRNGWGYPTSDLDRIPAAALESPAGVGYFLDLARLQTADSAAGTGQRLGVVINGATAGDAVVLT